MSERLSRPEPTIPVVAVVGAGVIGRSWALVFARGGCATRLYDPDAGQLERAVDWLRRDLDAAVAGGLLPAAEAGAIREAVSPRTELGDALTGAGYVQECGPERMEAKQAIFRDLERYASADALLASSTSALDLNIVTTGMKGLARCLVAHPVNPPHVIPAVEILPGRATAQAAVGRAVGFLRSVGQTPVVLRKYAVGFALNRMQVALIREAINLVNDGVADVEAVDALIRDGLGLRWVLMGPFGVGHTNADGGIREYYTRYRQSLVDIMDALGGTPEIDPALIERIGRGTDAMLGRCDHGEMLRWRDRLILEIRRLKSADPAPFEHAR
jgi:3-hydroxyacyl-CoA dehydrogenase